jgi:hypothetical protein
MKKLTHLFIAICMPIAVQAQTVNNMEDYTVPYQIDRANCDATNVDPGHPGQSNVWTFTNLTPQDTSSEWILSPSITAASARFPAANEVRVTVDGNDSTFVFYEKQNISLCLGSTDNTNTYDLHFRLPGIFIAKRPISYPEMLVHGYQIAHSSGGPATGMGDGSTQADGGGTLHLPTGVYNNALRVKTIIHQEDTISRTPLIATITDVVRYAWYNDNFKAPLLAWDSTHVDYGTSSVDEKTVSYLVSEGYPTSVKTTAAPHYRHHVYFTNSTTLNLQSDMPQGRSYELTILSAGGQKLYSSGFTSGKLNTFDTGTELPTGMYLIRISEKGSANATTVKLIKH